MNSKSKQTILDTISNFCKKDSAVFLGKKVVFRYDGNWDDGVTQYESPLVWILADDLLLIQKMYKHEERRTLEAKELLQLFNDTWYNVCFMSNLWDDQICDIRTNANITEAKQIFDSIIKENDRKNSNPGELIIKNWKTGEVVLSRSANLPEFKTEIIS